MNESKEPMEPCRNCGNTDLLWHYADLLWYYGEHTWRKHLWGHQYVCPECGMAGPVGDTEYDARAKWNAVMM